MVVRSMILFMLLMLPFGLAHADDEMRFEPMMKIMKYEQLMQLPASKRLEYVQGIREIVRDFEKRQISNSKTTRLSAELLFLEQFVERAEAMGAGPGGGRTAPSYSMAEKAFGCAEKTITNQRLLWILSTHGSYACVSPKPSYARQDPTQVCPTGMSPTNIRSVTPGRSMVCIQRGNVNISFEQFKAQRAAQQRQAAQKAAQLQAQAQAQAKANLVAKAKAASAKPQKRAVASATRQRAQEESQELSEANESMQNFQTTDINNKYTADWHPTLNTDDHVTGKQTLGTFLDAGQARTLHVDIDQKNVDSRCADGPKLDPASCNDDAIKQAKLLYYRDKNPHCIYAGSLSHFANNQKRPGNCKPSPDFCLNSVTCRDKNGSPIDGSKISLSCSDKSQVLCNPYLFNLRQGSNEPICVPTGANATEQCAKEADVEQNKGAPLFLNIAQTTTGSTDTERFTGIQEGWNAFADTMNDMCFKTPSKIVYCRECQILKERVAKLGLAVTEKRLVQEENGQCFFFRHMDEVDGVNNSLSRSGNSRH